MDPKEFEKAFEAAISPDVDHDLAAYIKNLFNSGCFDPKALSNLPHAFAKAFKDLGKLHNNAARYCQVKMALCGGGYDDDVAIRCFLAHHQLVSSGSTGTIPESTISPAAGLAESKNFAAGTEQWKELLDQVVVVKLNGGLGTGMGLDKAKSLVNVRPGKTFLDFIGLQVEYMQQTLQHRGLRFMLLNSFSTSSDTNEYLVKHHPALMTDSQEVVWFPREVMQGRVPKIDQATLAPAEYPQDRDNEWCPPGHGEIYAALYSSGMLERLLTKGYKYMFISNSDNLGATLDGGILQYLADSPKIDFLMEVCERTAADKKGGHLCQLKESGQLILRESAQCPKDDEASFQDITKHRFFNTNNLWLKLPALQAELIKFNGALPLPVIRNGKTVNPTDPTSTKVFQLESAMGSAIALFANSSAIVVPRSRFAPVKTCNDLLSLRSNCYVETVDHRLELSSERNGTPPNVSLDDKHYKFVSQFEELVKNGIPNMLKCHNLQIVGKAEFAEGVVLEGDVKFVNDTEERKVIKAGTYTGEVVL